MEDLYLIINEFWYEHWEAHKKNMINENKISLIAELSSNSGFSISRVLFNTFMIDMKNDIWNSVCVYESFEPNTMYRLDISNAKVLCGKADRFSVIIKDSVTNDIKFNRYSDFESPKSYFFYVNEVTHKLQLKVYSGVAGKCDGISISFDITITKVSIAGEMPRV